MNAVYQSFPNAPYHIITLDVDGLIQSVYIGREYDTFEQVIAVQPWCDNGTDAAHMQHLLEGVYDNTYVIDME
jgi:hypothetical protein